MQHQKHAMIPITIARMIINGINIPTILSTKEFLSLSELSRIVVEFDLVGGLDDVGYNAAVLQIMFVKYTTMKA